MPPYASGTVQHSMPAAPAFSHSSRETTPDSSQAAWCGAISCSMKRRTVSRNASWSSLNRVRLNTGFPSDSGLGLDVGRYGLVRLRLVQHLLGDERQDHLLGDRRDAGDRHLAEQPLDV